MYCHRRLRHTAVSDDTAARLSATPREAVLLGLADEFANCFGNSAAVLRQEVAPVGDPERADGTVLACLALATGSV